MLSDKKLLIIAPARLGDTVFCTPAIRFLKQTSPDAKITVIAVSQLSGAVLQNNPNIDELIITPTDDQLNKLRHQFEAAINLHDTDKAQEYIAKLEINSVYNNSTKHNSSHQAQQALEFVANLIEKSANLESAEKHYDIFPQQENFSSIDKMLDAENVDPHSQRLIGCHLGCHGLTKKRSRIWGKLKHNKAWPLKSFIKLEKKLRKFDPSIRFVVTGSKEERSLGEKFIQRCPTAINLIDKTSVQDLAALMSRLDTFITSDTGALHVACATDVKVIALFGKTSPAMTGPFPEKDSRIVLQNPDLAKLSVKEVFNRLVNL